MDDDGVDSAVPLLPCGADPVEVWDASRADRLPPHVAGCPYCTAVVEEERLVRAGALEPAPGLPGAPPSVLPGVLARVRAELRQGAELPLPSSAGPAAVTERALVEAVRTAADGVPQVQVRGVRVLPGPPVVVELGLGVPFGARAVEAAADVRARVGEALAGWGLSGRVDVAVEDVLP